MILNGRVLTTLVMFILFAGASLLALELPQKAAFMPLLIGIPGALLCVWQLALDVRRERRAEPAKADAGDDDGDEGGASEAAIFLWLGAFTVVLLSLGFLVGGPLIVTAFVRYSSRESWRNALAAGFGTFLVIWGVFTLILELPLFDGLLLGPLL